MVSAFLLVLKSLITSRNMNVRLGAFPYITKTQCRTTSILVDNRSSPGSVDRVETGNVKSVASTSKIIKSGYTFIILMAINRIILETTYEYYALHITLNNPYICT